MGRDLLPLSPDSLATAAALLLLPLGPSLLATTVTSSASVAPRCARSARALVPSRELEEA
ncbi:hypothetical protein [Microvirga massiliensis]|uniref:hypothetical protein n=1 Tax=Microvirga massiliensis TaxID=1033741 RepID=UPI0006603A75|nr:hypothetical protein [Microvirga massiliensis]